MDTGNAGKRVNIFNRQNVPNMAELEKMEAEQKEQQASARSALIRQVSTCIITIDKRLTKVQLAIPMCLLTDCRMAAVEDNSPLQQQQTIQLITQIREKEGQKRTGAKLGVKYYSQPNITLCRKSRGGDLELLRSERGESITLGEISQAKQLTFNFYIYKPQPIICSYCYWRIHLDIYFVFVPCCAYCITIPSSVIKPITQCTFSSTTIIFLDSAEYYLGSQCSIFWEQFGSTTRLLQILHDGNRVRECMSINNETRHQPKWIELQVFCFVLHSYKQVYSAVVGS